MNSLLLVHHYELGTPYWFDFCFTRRADIRSFRDEVLLKPPTPLSFGFEFRRAAVKAALL